MLSKLLPLLLPTLTFISYDDAVPDLVISSSCKYCFKLHNEKEIPALGLGTSRIGESDDVVVRAIKDAIEVGYRHIDTADFYKNEEAIGRALEDVFHEGKVKRDEIFVTTKVWSNHHTEELALKSVRNSLKKLRLDYIDLVLVHWPMTFQSGGEYVPRTPNGTIIGSNLSKENFELAYKGLEKAVRLGLSRSIGVSNFNVKQMEKIFMIAEIKPTVNQVECHPFLIQQNLLNYCTRNGVRLEAYSPLRRGDKQFLENETLKMIAAKYGRTTAQIALRWQIQRGVIVIPKTSRRTRMIENKKLFDFTLTNDEMRQVNALNKNDRVIAFEDAKHLPEYPF